MLSSWCSGPLIYLWHLHEEINFWANVEQVWQQLSSSHHPPKQAEWRLNSFFFEPLSSKKEEFVVEERL